MGRTYHWDFAGPDALGTARHFQLHLVEFLEMNGVADCETGVTELAPNRFTAWCRASEAAITLIQKTLRPPRVVES